MHLFTPLPQYIGHIVNFPIVGQSLILFYIPGKLLCNMNGVGLSPRYAFRAVKFCLVL